MRYLLIVVGLIFPIGLATAQTFGEITGEVHDQSGAAAPNASVTVTNTATSASRSTTTNDLGIYSFPSLVPGTYQIRVQLQGFQPVVRTGVELEVQQTARVDFTLTVGQATQAIEVAGAGVLLATENATVGTVIDEKEDRRLALEWPRLPSAGGAEPERNVRIPGSQSGRGASGRNARLREHCDLRYEGHVE